MNEKKKHEHDTNIINAKLLSGTLREASIYDMTDLRLKWIG